MADRIERLLATYTLEEILEYNDLTLEELLEHLYEQEYIDFPTEPLG